MMCRVVLLLLVVIGSVATVAVASLQDDHCSPAQRTALDLCDSWVSVFARTKGVKRNLICANTLKLTGASLTACERMANELTKDIKSFRHEVLTVRVFHPLVCAGRLSHLPLKHRPHKGCFKASRGASVTCLWMHGARFAKFTDRDTSMGFRKFLVESDRYWSSDKVSKAEMVPHCTHNVYLRMNTYTGSWDDDALQRQYCKAIDMTQADLIFTHSMANVIVAGGVARKLPGCHNIGKKETQVQWFGLGGPLTGAQISDHLIDVCGKSIFQKAAILKIGLHVVGLCKTEKSVFHGSDMVDMSIPDLSPSHVNKAVGYASDEPAVPQFSCPRGEGPARDRCITIMDISEKHMSGSMCGTTPYQTIAPLKTTSFFNKIKQTLIAKAHSLVFKTPWAHGDGSINIKNVPYSQRTGSDGMVGLHECQLFGGKGYSTKPSLFYLAAIDHLSERGNFGDNKQRDQQPNKWFEICAKHVSDRKARAFRQRTIDRFIRPKKQQKMQG